MSTETFLLKIYNKVSTAEKQNMLSVFYKIIRAGLPIALFLILSFNFIGLSPKKADALVPACPTCVPTDAPVANFFLTSIAKDETTIVTKELGWDGIALQAAQLVIGEMTEAIVTWINRGFEDGPTFVTDPADFFADVGDQIAGDFIDGTELGFLCEPFALDIRIALNLSYNSTFTQRNYCRLSDVIANTENFAKYTAGDFSQGGWASWFEISQNPSNNPVGVYLESKNELAIRTASGKSISLAKLDWGKGFLSSQDCLVPNHRIEVDEAGNETSVEEPGCKTLGPIKTPGSVIESQLENTLGSGIRKLELADEFNEIVGALIGQLAQTVLTQGLSSFADGGDNENYLNQSEADRPPLTVVCTSSDSEVTTGEQVTWTANVFGGIPGTNTYLWRGTGPVQGRTTRTITVTYPNPGIKTANITVSRTTGGNQVNIEDCDPIEVVQ